MTFAEYGAGVKVKPIIAGFWASESPSHFWNVKCWRTVAKYVNKVARAKISPRHTRRPIHYYYNLYTTNIGQPFISTSKRTLIFKTTCTALPAPNGITRCNLLGINFLSESKNLSGRNFSKKQFVIFV